MQTNSNKKILIIVGSLRKDSFNKKLAEAVKKLAPAELETEIFDLKDIPLFNQDNELNLPPAVSEFKGKIEAADAILVVTPEYNYSFPGVLKNALDWASRPHGKNSFRGKPAGIIGASTSSLGSSRAVYQLRQVFVSLDTLTLSKPEIMIPAIHEKFSENGELTDEFTKEKLKDFLVTFSQWIERFA